MSIVRLVVFGVLMEVAFLALYAATTPLQADLLFIGIYGVTFAFFAYAVVALRSMKSDETEPAVVAVILGFAVLFRLSLVFHAPVASDDIYRYVWDGKVAAHGTNPFALAPDSPQLSPLATGELPAKINFPLMRTIYPPLAQIFFFVSYELFGDSVSGMKLLLVVADLLSIGCLMLILKQLRLGGAYVLLYAWSPLPILYFAVDGHLDALGIPFMLLALYLAFRNRYIAAAVQIGLAALVKLHPLFLAPLLARARRGVHGLLLLSFPVLMLAAGYALYYEPTGGLFESLTTYNRQWEFNGSVFKLLLWALHSNEAAHVTSGITFIIWLVFVCVLDRPLVERVFLAVLGFYLVSPVVQPWYLTWLAALLVVRWSTAVFLFLGLSGLSNLVVYHYHKTGIWADRIDILLLEYVPVLVLLVVGIAQGKFSKKAVAHLEK